jgi:hypothetical protein
MLVATITMLYLFFIPVRKHWSQGRRIDDVADRISVHRAFIVDNWLRLLYDQE